MFFLIWSILSSIFFYSFVITYRKKYIPLFLIIFSFLILPKLIIPKNTDLIPSTNLIIVLSMINIFSIFYIFIHLFLSKNKKKFFLIIFYILFLYLHAQFLLSSNFIDSMFKIKNTFFPFVFFLYTIPVIYSFSILQKQK